MAKDNLHNELEGLHFDILNDYIEKGATDDMPEELVEYMQQLEFVRQRMDRVESPTNVIKSLRAFYPKLNLMQAKSRFNDALMFFHVDETPKKVWNNYLFEISMKAIQLAVKTIESPEQSLKIVDAVLKAKQIKDLDKDEEEAIDERLFEEKVEIHTITPGDLGLPEANKRTLAAQIDEMPLQEEQKLKLKMEAGVEPRQILNWNNEQTED